GALFWRAFQSVLVYVGTVPAEIAVVSEHLPRHRVMVLADAQKAAEAQHGVGNFAAGLVNHDVLDRTDFLVSGAIDGFPRLLIAGDEVAGSAFGVHCASPLLGGKNAIGAAMVPRRAAFRRRRHPVSEFQLVSSIATNSCPCPSLTTGA